MSWAAANVREDEQQQISAQSRDNDDADAENKKCYEAAVRAHHSGSADDLQYAGETYAALLRHSRLCLPPEELSAGNKQLRLLCLNNLGSLRETQENFPEALGHYAEAAAMDGGRVKTWHRLGIVAEATKRWRLARFAYEQGLRINPAHISCQMRLEKLLEFMDDAVAVSQLPRTSSGVLGHHRAAVLRSAVPAPLEDLSSDLGARPTSACTPWSSLGPRKVCVVVGGATTDCRKCGWYSLVSGCSSLLAGLTSESKGLPGESAVCRALTFEFCEAESDASPPPHEIVDPQHITERDMQTNNEARPANSATIESEQNGALHAVAVPTSKKNDVQPTPTTAGTEQEGVTTTAPAHKSGVSRDRTEADTATSTPIDSPRGSTKRKKSSQDTPSRRVSARHRAKQAEEAERAREESRRNNLEAILELLVLPPAALSHSMKLSEAQRDEALRSQDPLCMGDVTAGAYVNRSERSDAMTSTMAAVEDTRTISQRFFDVRMHERRRRVSDHTSKQPKSASVPETSVAETMNLDLRTFARAVQENNFGPGNVLATFLCSATAHVGEFEAPEPVADGDVVDEPRERSAPSRHRHQGLGLSYSSLEHFAGHAAFPGARGVQSDICASNVALHHANGGDIKRMRTSHSVQATFSNETPNTNETDVAAYFAWQRSKSQSHNQSSTSADDVEANHDETASSAMEKRSTGSSREAQVDAFSPANIGLTVSSGGIAPRKRAAVAFNGSGSPNVYADRRLAKGRFFVGSTAQARNFFCLEHLFEETHATLPIAADTRPRFPGGAVVQQLQKYVCRNNVHAASPQPVWLSTGRPHGRKAVTSAVSLMLASYRSHLSIRERLALADAVLLAAADARSLLTLDNKELNPRILLACAECLLFRATVVKKGRLPSRARLIPLNGESPSTFAEDDSIDRDSRLTGVRRAKEFLELFAQTAWQQQACDEPGVGVAKADVLPGAFTDRMFLLHTMLSAVALDLEGDLTASMSAMRHCAAFFAASNKSTLSNDETNDAGRGPLFRTFLCDVTGTQLTSLSQRRNSATALQSVYELLRTHATRKGTPTAIQQKIFSTLLAQFASTESGDSSKATSATIESETTHSVPAIHGQRPSEVSTQGETRSTNFAARGGPDDVVVKCFRNLTRIVDDFVDRLAAAKLRNIGVSTSSLETPSANGELPARKRQRKKQRKRQRQQEGLRKQEDRNLVDVFFSACGEVGRSDIAVLLASTLLRSVSQLLPQGCGVQSPSKHAAEAPDGTNIVHIGAGHEVFSATRTAQAASDSDFGDEVEGKGCEICGADDHNDKVLLCDGEQCALGLRLQNIPVKEYHMYCLRPQILKVPEGDFVGPCCDPLGWAAKSAANETAGRLPNPPPADSVAAKQLADKVTAGTSVGSVQKPAASKSLTTDPQDMSIDELELVNDAESETLDVLSVDAPLTHDAAVKFAGLLIRETAGAIRKSDAMRRRRKEHQTVPNQVHTSDADGGRPRDSRAASVTTFPIDAPQAMLARQAVPLLLMMGLNLAWRDLDIELMKSAVTLAHFANCMDLFFHHCNVSFCQLLGIATRGTQMDLVAIGLGARWRTRDLVAAWKQAPFYDFLRCCFELIKQGARASRALITDRCETNVRLLRVLASSTISLLQVYHAHCHQAPAPMELSFQNGIGWVVEFLLRDPRAVDAGNLASNELDCLASPGAAFDRMGIVAETADGVLQFLCRAHNHNLAAIVQTILSTCLDLYGLVAHLRRTSGDNVLALEDHRQGTHVAGKNVALPGTRRSMRHSKAQSDADAVGSSCANHDSIIANTTPGARAKEWGQIVSMIHECCDLLYDLRPVTGLGAVSHKTIQRTRALDPDTASKIWLFTLNEIYATAEASSVRSLGFAERDGGVNDRVARKVLSGDSVGKSVSILERIDRDSSNFSLHGIARLSASSKAVLQAAISAIGFPRGLRSNGLKANAATKGQDVYYVLARTRESAFLADTFASALLKRGVASTELSRTAFLQLPLLKFGRLLDGTGSASTAISDNEELWMTALLPTTGSNGTDVWRGNSVWEEDRAANVTPGNSMPYRASRDVRRACETGLYFFAEANLCPRKATDFKHTKAKELNWREQMNIHHSNMDVCLADLAQHPTRLSSWRHFADKALHVYFHSVDAYVFGLSMFDVDVAELADDADAGEIFRTDAAAHPFFDLRPLDKASATSTSPLGPWKPSFRNYNVGTSLSMWVTEADLRRDARVAMRAMQVELCLYLSVLSDHTIESEGEDSSPDSAERSSLIPILLDTKRWQAAAHTVRAVAEKHEEQQATWVLSLARDLLRCCEGLMVYLYTRIQSCAPECISFPSSEQLRVEASSSSAAVSDMMSKRTLALLDLKILIERTQMIYDVRSQAASDFETAFHSRRSPTTPDTPRCSQASSSSTGSNGGKDTKSSRSVYPPFWDYLLAKCLAKLGCEPLSVLRVLTKAANASMTIQLLVQDGVRPASIQSAWPYAQLGIDFDIYLRLQATALEFLCCSDANSTAKHVREWQQDLRAALQVGAADRVNEVHGALDYVKAFVRNVRACLDRDPFSHRAKHLLEFSHAWLARNGCAPPPLEQGLESVFLLAQSKRAGANRPLIGVWLDKLKPTTANYDQLDRRRPKYNALRFKYVKAYVQHLSNRHAILRLGKLLHQLEVSDDVRNGVPKRMAEDWAHCVGYAIVSLFDEALKASFQCRELSDEGAPSTPSASVGIAGVYLAKPGETSHDYVGRVRAHLRCAFQAYTEMKQYHSRRFKHLYRRLSLHVSQLVLIFKKQTSYIVMHASTPLEYCEELFPKVQAKTAPRKNRMRRK